jgi:hypothetical protein
MATSQMILDENNQETDTQLKNTIVSKIIEMGCACPTNLASEIGHGKKAADLIEPLESLVKSGVLRHRQDKKDPRQYNEHQIVYELSR